MCAFQKRLVLPEINRCPDATVVAQDKSFYHKIRLKLHVQVVNDNQQKFVIFTDLLNDYMNKHDLTKKSVSEIEEYILLQPSITIKHEEKGHVAFSVN